MSVKPGVGGGTDDGELDSTVLTADEVEAEIGVDENVEVDSETIEELVVVSTLEKVLLGLLATLLGMTKLLSVVELLAEDDVTDGRPIELLVKLLEMIKLLCVAEMLTEDEVADGRPVELPTILLGMVKLLSVAELLTADDVTNEKPVELVPSDEGIFDEKSLEVKLSGELTDSLAGVELLPGRLAGVEDTADEGVKELCIAH